MTKALRSHAPNGVDGAISASRLRAACTALQSAGAARSNPADAARRHAAEALPASRLAEALPPMLRWLRSRLGDEAPPRSGDRPDQLPGDLAALHEQWRRREAHALSAAMTRAGREPPADALDPVRPAAPARRRALLVDDARDILVVIGAFLTSFGFDVVRAENSEAALQAMAVGGPFDLLVSDYAMNGMNGFDLVCQSMQRLPALRSLIITGYSAALGAERLPPNVLLLGKPFRRAELAEKIALLFADAPAAAAADRAPRSISA